MLSSASVDFLELEQGGSSASSPSPGVSGWALEFSIIFCTEQGERITSHFVFGHPIHQHGLRRRDIPKAKIISETDLRPSTLVWLAARSCHCLEVCESKRCLVFFEVSTACCDLRDLSLEGLQSDFSDGRGKYVLTPLLSLVLALEIIYRQMQTG